MWFYFVWALWAVFVLSMFALIVPRIVALLDRIVDALFGKPAAFKVVPYEQTEWGMMFKVVACDRPDDILFLDRWKPAHEKCAALNADL